MVDFEVALEVFALVATVVVEVVCVVVDGTKAKFPPV